MQEPKKGKCNGYYAVCQYKGTPMYELDFSDGVKGYFCYRCFKMYKALRDIPPEDNDKRDKIFNEMLEKLRNIKDVDINKILKSALKKEER